MLLQTMEQGAYNSLPERGHLPNLNKTLGDKKKSPYQSNLGKERMSQEDFHMCLWIPTLQTAFLSFTLTAQNTVNPSPSWFLC